ncbi:hypothetical protein D3C76_1796800 [compost metagenome]
MSAGFGNGDGELLFNIEPARIRASDPDAVAVLSAVNQSCHRLQGIPGDGEACIAGITLTCCQ